MKKVTIEFEIDETKLDDNALASLGEFDSLHEALQKQMGTLVEKATNVAIQSEKDCLKYMLANPSRMPSVDRKMYYNGQFSLQVLQQIPKGEVRVFIQDMPS